MVDITMLELHLDGSTLAANTPFGDSGGEADETDESGGRSRLLPVVVGLVFLVVVAYLARRRLGGDEEEEVEPPVTTGTGTDTEIPAEP